MFVHKVKSESNGILCEDLPLRTNKNRLNFLYVFSRSRRSQDLQYKYRCNKLIKLHSFDKSIASSPGLTAPPIPKSLSLSVSIHIIDYAAQVYCIFFKSKLHHWFKSDGYFDELVDFAYC